MKSKKNLVLLGMMGSGKSTIGYLLSKKLRRKFIDIDKFIEKNVNMTISEIFKKKGEIFFRSLEEKITIKHLKSNNNIISLGGGGFINEKVRKEVVLNCISFWLNWDTQTILKRINKSKKRPLAYNANKNMIGELIENRSKIYAKAKFKIDCNKLSKTEIVNKIINLNENN